MSIKRKTKGERKKIESPFFGSAVSTKAHNDTMNNERFPYLYGKMIDDEIIDGLDSLIQMPSLKDIVESGDMLGQVYYYDGWELENSGSDVIRTLMDYEVGFRFAVWLFGEEAFHKALYERVQWAESISRSVMATKIFNGADDADEQMTDSTWQRIRRYIDWKQTINFDIGDGDYIIINGNNWFEGVENWQQIYEYEDFRSKVFRNDSDSEFPIDVDIDYVLILRGESIRNAIKEVAEDLLEERLERRKVMVEQVFTELFSKAPTPKTLMAH